MKYDVLGKKLGLILTLRLVGGHIRTEQSCNVVDHGDRVFLYFIRQNKLDYDRFKLHFCKSIFSDKHAIFYDDFRDSHLDLGMQMGQKLTQLI